MKDNEELQKKLEQQNLAEREMEDIIRVWSHQMKVPLAAIDLMTQTQVNSEELKNQVFSLENYLKILLEYQRINNLAT
ncbi:sensor histidine kinase, partial [Staphylococcus epidermidis]